MMVKRNGAPGPDAEQLIARKMAVADGADPNEMWPEYLTSAAMMIATWRVMNSGERIVFMELANREGAA